MSMSMSGQHLRLESEQLSFSDGLSGIFTRRVKHGRYPKELLRLVILLEKSLFLDIFDSYKASHSQYRLALSPRQSRIISFPIVRSTRTHRLNCEIP